MQCTAARKVVTRAAPVHPDRSAAGYYFALTERAPASAPRPPHRPLRSRLPNPLIGLSCCAPVRRSHTPQDLTRAPHTERTLNLAEGTIPGHARYQRAPNARGIMITILVAEDEFHILRLIQRQLNPPLPCRPFDNGDDALACALGQRPDVLLLDIMLPGANGLRFAGKSARYGDAAPR